jgi:uncharacterized protein (DUF2345 family)
LTKSAASSELRRLAVPVTVTSFCKPWLVWNQWQPGSCIATFTSAAWADQATAYHGEKPPISCTIPAGILSSSPATVAQQFGQFIDQA